MSYYFLVFLFSQSSSLNMNEIFAISASSRKKIFHAVICRKVGREEKEVEFLIKEW